MTRQVCALLPIFASLVVYWGVQGQMATTFFNQGCQMDLRLGGATVPVACLNLFNNVIIIALVPVFDGYVYPRCRRAGFELGPLAKIGAGMALEALVMVAAAAREARRGARARRRGRRPVRVRAERRRAAAGGARRRWRPRSPCSGRRRSSSA